MQHGCRCSGALVTGFRACLESGSGPARVCAEKKRTYLVADSGEARCDADTHDREENDLGD
jgi:hypothetical protein